MAMAYGNVYVANVSLANPGQVVKAFMEAEAYDGPSIIIAYAHCIAHGIDMTTAVDEQKKAVSSGYWPLYRFNPALAAEGKNPLQLDSKAPTISLRGVRQRREPLQSPEKDKPRGRGPADEKGQRLGRQPFRVLPETGCVDLRKIVSIQGPGSSCRYII